MSASVMTGLSASDVAMRRAAIAIPQSCMRHEDARMRRVPALAWICGQRPGLARSPPLQREQIDAETSVLSPGLVPGVQGENPVRPAILDREPAAGGTSRRLPSKDKRTTEILQRCRGPPGRRIAPAVRSACRPADRLRAGTRPFFACGCGVPGYAGSLSGNMPPMWS